MKNITLLLPLEATTDMNPNNSSGVTVGTIARVTAGVTAGALID